MTSGYWTLNRAEDLRALAAASRGKRVLDLGSFDDSLGLYLLQNGAQSVVGVDHKDVQRVKHPNLTHVPMLFRDFAPQAPKLRWDITVLSWPANTYTSMQDLIPILELCDEVCILGWFDNSTICGDYPLWRYLISQQWDCDKPAVNPGSFFMHYRRRSRRLAFTRLEVYILDTWKHAPLPI